MPCLIQVITAFLFPVRSRIGGAESCVWVGVAGMSGGGEGQNRKSRMIWRPGHRLRARAGPGERERMCRENYGLG
ncbi:hypothetical protein F4775DRAFT_571200 [Biscogniauxia sp. FL1348]|nr:hypothetical protein F4775DRAFT_571200 [Biscogniauxia sp. FL1348]